MCIRDSFLSPSRSRCASEAPTASGCRRRVIQSRLPAARRKNGVTQSRVVRVPSTSNAATAGQAGGGGGTSRWRLYTRSVSDGPEIFDDLYLGLQAGGALRKQRRGEELRVEPFVTYLRAKLEDAGLLAPA